MDRKMKRPWKVLLFLIMALAAFGSGCSKKSEDEVKTIQESGTLRVALVDTESRYTSMEGETPVGMEPDLAEYIAQALGVSVQYQMKSRQEALAALTAGEADIAMGCINASAGLTSDFLASTPYGKGFVYAVTKKGTYVLTLGAMENMQVGVTGNLDDETRAALYAAEGIAIVNYGSAEEAAAALKDETIGAYLCYEAQAEELLKDEALQVQSISNLDPEEFVAAAPKNSRTLISGINVLIQQFLETE